MQDRSNEVLTETYEAYSMLEDGNGEVVQKFPMKTTVTDNRFNIEWGKTLAQNCKIMQKEISEEDKLEIQKKFDTFPEKFKLSLQNCVLDSASRTLLFFDDNIEIKGLENNQCILENQNFTLTVSQDKLTSIQTWEDFYRLVEDKQISQYHYDKKYEKTGLLWAIDACSRKNSGSKGSRSETLGDITIKASLAYKYNLDKCEIVFENTLERNHQKEDYSLVCHLSDDQVQGVLQQYAELIEKYGEKVSQQGMNFSFKSAQSNDEVRAAEANIMTFFQDNNLCKIRLKEDYSHYTVEP